MYSAVLMLAMTAGSESADFGRHGCSASYCCGTTTAYTCTMAYGCSTACSGRVRHHRKACHGCTMTTCSMSTCAAYMPACSAPVGCGGMKTMPAAPMPSGEKLPAPKPMKIFAPATIVVNLPTGARLSVDGTPTSSTSERRTLVTPSLEVGENYVYTLRAEFVSNGQTMTQSQQVTVMGGQTSRVQFDFSQNVASR